MGQQLSESLMPFRDLAVHPSFWTGNCHLRQTEKQTFWNILHHGHFDHFRQFWTGTTIQKDRNFKILAKCLCPSPKIKSGAATLKQCHGPFPNLFPPTSRTASLIRVSAPSPHMVSDKCYRPS